MMGFIIPIVVAFIVTCFALYPKRKRIPEFHEICGHPTQEPQTPIWKNIRRNGNGWIGEETATGQTVGISVKTLEEFLK